MERKIEEHQSVETTRDIVLGDRVIEKTLQRGGQNEIRE